MSSDECKLDGILVERFVYCTDIAGNTNAPLSDKTPEECVIIQKRIKRRPHKNRKPLFKAPLNTL